MRRGPSQAESSGGPSVRSPEFVHVVEVGPRDGLQNESAAIPTAEKIRFVDALSAAGCPTVEVTSFVSPSAVPQLADAVEVMSGIERQPGVRYLALVPNERGLLRAVDASCTSIAIFAAATESFSQANLRASIDGAFARFEAVARGALEAGMTVRGYVSVALTCPFEGPVAPARAMAVAQRLRSIGCAEIALADTIGTATPEEVERLLDACLGHLPVDQLALHLHDTSGHGLANVDVGLDAGLRMFDSAAGGLGGCPFAPGAPGNLASEALLDHLSAAGYRTGINPDAVRNAVRNLRTVLGKAIPTALPA